MSASYIQIHIIFIWILTVGQCFTVTIVEQDDTVIIIDQHGTSNSECCKHGNCSCSNLSLALEHLQDNTEIRLQSDISLHDIVVFGNVSYVKLAGDSNPTVRCDHQGGLVGKSINYIVIQGITWDTCYGINALSFQQVYIVKCNFLNCTHFALTLHGLGSVNISGSTFSHNNGSIDVLASSVNIYGSKFFGDEKTAILVNAMNDNNTLPLHNMLSNVTIEYCGFSNIYEHCVYCIGGASLLQNLSISSTNFTINTNTAVNSEQCNVTLNNVTFYKNVNYINDGGAVRVYNGTLNMTGEILFSHNRAGSNGGAIYLDHSVMFASQGSFLFHNNTADNGGAIYISEDSRLYTLPNKSSLEFLENNAMTYGGAVYIDLQCIDNVTIGNQLSNYYFGLLTSTYCTCNFSNNALMGDCAYFDGQCSNIHLNYSYNPNLIGLSTSCSFGSYAHSVVYVNVTNITYGSLNFWSHDLHLAVAADCPGPVSASFNCCDSTNGNGTMDNEMGNFTVTSKNSVIECANSNTITCNIFINESNEKVYVTVQRFGLICDDIAHVQVGIGCLPVCPPYDPYRQTTYIPLQTCWVQTIRSGYWYDNGFKWFVASCPTGHYNKHFNLQSLLYDQLAIFPDRDLQCNAHWGSLACGECNYSAGYAIKYDTTECVPVDECLTTLVRYSLLILFGVSFFYWIAVISFIFVLLHFRFDITAGYAYGLLFYYSVLEQVVNDVTDHLTKNLENSYGNDFDDPLDDDVDGIYDLMRLKVLPFLSSIGNLKPPFTGFMNLCFHDAEMIDHLMLEYIHPLIVTFLVVIIYVLARNFVIAARSIGRYINSKSICILLLLSYSSITYTSMQLLKPMPVFQMYGMNSAMQIYWSPTMKYFHGRHVLYGIIALFCELIIGIGLPIFLIFQKYFIRYCNINFTSMKHITDQLMGCYKEEYRWFAAYYLICRQVLYGVNNLIDYGLGFWDRNEGAFDGTDTPFPKFTIIIIICISIMVIHAMFQPYKRKGLNILDTFILLFLVGLLLSGLEIYSNRMISIIFWFLPLLILINYLACFTKLKYLIIPCTCIAIFAAVFYFAAFGIPRTYIHFEFGVFTILSLASSSVVFIAYVIYVLKCLYTRCCRGRPRYLAINEQDDEVDCNNDNNIAEVCS